MDKLDLKFKDFEIRLPIMLGGQPPPPNTYDIVKWVEDTSNDKSTQYRYCFSIAKIKCNPIGEDWEFESVGYRYLIDREDGLEEFILAFMKLVHIQMKYGKIEEKEIINNE